MFCLVYMSVATRPFEQQALGEVLVTSQRNNERDEITGMLLNAGGNFIQALEGQRPLVENTYRRICNDPRHRITSVMLRLEIQRRVFPSWAMELLSMDELPEELRAPAAHLWQINHSGASTKRQRSAAEVLLDSFRNSMNFHKQGV